jgi:hypothetical protein
MAQLFARIELRGDPGFEIYRQLHGYMKSNHWYQFIEGRDSGLVRRVDLPHAVYQAVNSGTPNFLSMAQEIRTYIQANIWADVIVLVIEANNWALDPS